MARLDPKLHFAQQDAEKLGRVYRMASTTSMSYIFYSKYLNNIIQMRKTFDWLDTRRFPGDWATADMTKQYLRGRRKQIAKSDKISREAEAEDLANERRRRQAYLQKRTILEEGDPESLAIEGTNKAPQEDNSNWPPTRPKKKRRVSPVPSESSDSQSPEEDASN